ncbi:MAG: YraN family protein [Rhizobacter sp.]|nr:YraN family protein [Chlorobiales bacterium]
MSQQTTDFGKQSEDLACEYLRERGFEILHRNYRYGKNEIDIITKRANTVSFVEVKARRSTAYGHPAEAVTKTKQKEIVKVATYFIAQQTNSTLDYRFDVLTILHTAQTLDISFIEDAFRVF